MEARSNVSPVPLTLHPGESQMTLEYLDGRRVEYEAPLETQSGSVSANVAYEIHVLVTDADETEGIMTYVNDYDTSDEILESTGVGRVLLDVDDREALYPGVTARRSADQITIDVEADAIDGSVYAFVENQLDERVYRLV